MKIKQILRLPVDTSGYGDIRIISTAISLLAKFEYNEGHGGQIGKLQFDDVAAYRFRIESYSRGFVPGSGDTVVQIEESSWLKELTEGVPSGMNRGNRKHFALFLSSNGYLEVIAESVQLLPPEKGFLDS